MGRGSVMACGGKDLGRGMGEVWGNVLGCRSPTHFPTFPSPFFTSPLTSHTPIHFPTPPSHNSSHISPSSPHTPTHFPTITTSPLTFSKCDEVSVAKLLATVLASANLPKNFRGVKKVWFNFCLKVEFPEYEKFLLHQIRPKPPLRLANFKKGSVNFAVNSIIAFRSILSQLLS